MLNLQQNKKVKNLIKQQIELTRTSSIDQNMIKIDTPPYPSPQDTKDKEQNGLVSGVGGKSTIF